MKHPFLLLLIISPLFLIGCQSTVPSDVNSLSLSQVGVQNRISKSSDQFSKLAASQQKAVSSGNVSKGMSPEAVRLAWGKPDDIEKGSKEVWTYYRREVVDRSVREPSSTASSDSPLAKIGKFYSSSDKFYDGHNQSPKRTVKRINKTVVFEGGRVVSWTRARH